MDPALVFAKTAKGREEIDKRTHRLDARKRMLLITVDGASSAASLSAKHAHLDDAQALLQALWTEGFIEPLGQLAGTRPAPQAEISASALKTGRTLKELQRSASRSIESLLGPEGEAMAIALERTVSVEQFITEAQRTRETLRSFVGSRKADLFWNALGL